MKSTKNNNQKLDYDYRISSVFKLPYKNYSSNDSNALEILLKIKPLKNFTIDWNKDNKRFELIVYSGDGIYGYKFCGESLADTVKEFIQVYLK